MIYPEYFHMDGLDDIKNIDFKGKKAYFVAGGTDMMCYLRDGFINPEKSCVVDIAAVKELYGISEDSDYLKIGAMATFSDILESDLVKKWAPAVVSTAETFATPQIRNRATIGGNIGNASPAGDSLPPLAVHNAKVVAFGKNGIRTIDIMNVFAGPKKTNLANGELITAVLIPKIAEEKNFKLKGIFLKIGGRKTHIISKASVAIAGLFNGAQSINVNIALGAVGPTVIKADRAAGMLNGKKITPELIEKCCEEIKSAATPISDFRSTALYRSKVIAPLFKEAIMQLIK